MLMRVRAHLTINRIENINLEEACSLMVEIGWIGKEKKFKFLGKRTKRNCTSRKAIRDVGPVQWNEDFEHFIELRRSNQGGYKSWFIDLEVQKIVAESHSIAQKARIDIAEDLELGTERIIRISLDCNSRGGLTTAILEVKLRINDSRFERRTLSFPTTSLRLFSCIGGDHHLRNHNARPRMNGTTSHEFSMSGVRNLSTETCSSSEDDPEPSYKNLKLCNYLVAQFDREEEDSIDGREFSPNVDLSSSFGRRQPQNNSPLQRLFSLKSLLSFKKSDEPKGKPLLNKSCRDIGGDDIDIERHEESGISHSQRSKVHPVATSRNSAFGEDDLFQIGSWERRSVFSRDSELELVTNAFLATIDQRSEKASGGSACTVLVVVIADWLYKNPGRLPLQCELDQLVREGSIIWRDLCQDKNHMERFTDQHFDLETVLEEEIRELTEVVDWSHLGFFGRDELQESMASLQELPSFDSIWDDMMLNDHGLSERVYICSWNDHFFVLKIEKDVIYLIDTFGERLFEGCNQAYILKFDKSSVIYKEKTSPSEEIIRGVKPESHNEPKEGNNNMQDNGPSKKEVKRDSDTINHYTANKSICEEIEPSTPKEENCEDINHSLTNGVNREETTLSFKEEMKRDQLAKNIGPWSSKENICEGIESCREYIKSFLASLPLRQLQEDLLNRGSIDEETLHRRLQIEFHCVIPCIIED